MSTSRRDFVQLSILAGGAVGLGLARRAGAEGTAREPLKILVLGGTGLIGPPMVRYAVARGHEITLFNRGKTNSHLFPDLEKLRGDRDGNLAALEEAVAAGRRWDAVIDNTASIPRWVAASAGLLKDAADYYLYTSSISAYADSSTPGADETAPVGTISPEDEAAVKTTKDITGENYGPLKARCEAEARMAFTDERTCVVRPGLIVGPGDYSDRFTYWPVRIYRGGEVMAPGDPTDPVQFIDARDLGEWYIRLVEHGTTGIFNGGGNWGTKPTLDSTSRRWARGSMPSTSTRPSQVYSPSRQRISVVFPAPLEPTRAIRCPRSMVRSTCFRTSVRRKRLVTFSN